MATLGKEGFTQLVVSTLEKIEGKLVDQVLQRHPTLDLFARNASSDTGRSLVMNLEASEDESTVWTDESGSFNTDVTPDIMGAAEYEWSEPLVSKVRVPFKRLEMNSGKEQIVDLLKAHIESAKKGHGKKIAKALHASVPASGAISSFPVIVSADGSVGGIDPATGGKEYWSSTEVVAGRDEYPSIIRVFRTVENDLADATSDMSELTHIVAGRNVYEEYVNELDDKVRYVNLEGKNAGEANTKFKAVWFGDTEVRYDPDCDPDTAYFLDINTWRMKYLNGNWMKVQPAQTITGSLDFITPIASVLAVGTNERRANAVLQRPDEQPA